MLVQSKKITKCKSCHLSTKRQDLLNTYIQDHIGESICPVTLENYDFKNPPFLTDTCRHSISLNALKNFRIYTKVLENKRKLGVMRCPLCRKYFHFAGLNLSFFHLWYMSEISQKEESHLMITREEFAKSLKEMPRYFTPRDGCLSFF